MSDKGEGLATLLPIQLEALHRIGRLASAIRETHNLMMTRRGRPYPPRIKERQ